MEQPPCRRARSPGSATTSTAPQSPAPPSQAEACAGRDSRDETQRIDCRSVSRHPATVALPHFRCSGWDSKKRRMVELRTVADILQGRTTARFLAGGFRRTVVGTDTGVSIFGSEMRKGGHNRRTRARGNTQSFVPICICKECRLLFGVRNHSRWNSGGDSCIWLDQYSCGRMGGI